MIERLLYDVTDYGLPTVGAVAGALYVGPRVPRWYGTLAAAGGGWLAGYLAGKVGRAVLRPSMPSMPTQAHVPAASGGADESLPAPSGAGVEENVGATIRDPSGLQGRIDPTGAMGGGQVIDIQSAQASGGTPPLSKNSPSAAFDTTAFGTE